MARFGVYGRAGESGYLLDCQSDILDMLSTRLVVPLLPPDEGPQPISRLNPLFRIGDESLIMYTQFAATVPAQELKDGVASLAEEQSAIMNALDMLLTGY